MNDTLAKIAIPITFKIDMLSRVRFNRHEHKSIIAKKPTEDGLALTGRKYYIKPISTNKKNEPVIPTQKAVDLNVQQTSKVEERRKKAGVISINLPAIAKLRQKIAKIPKDYVKLFPGSTGNINIPVPMDMENNTPIQQPIVESVAQIQGEEPTYEPYHTPVNDEPVAMVSTEEPKIDSTEPIAVKDETQEAPIVMPQYQEDVAVLPPMASDTPSVVAEEVTAPQPVSINSGRTSRRMDIPSIVTVGEDEAKLGTIAQGLADLKRSHDELQKTADSATKMCITLQDELDSTTKKLEITEANLLEANRELAEARADMDRVLGEFESYQTKTAAVMENSKKLEEELTVKNNETMALRSENNRVVSIHNAFVNKVKGVVGQPEQYTTDSSLRRAA